MGLANEKMAEYEEACACLALVQADYAHKVETVMATIKDELDALEIELKPTLDSATTQKAEAESALKAAVLATGNTIRGSHLMAMWVKGRETWDTSKLAGFAVAHPELLELRKVGDPTVTIRAIK